MPAMLPMWGLRAELPALDWTQEKAKPTADPSTTAVKRSGSATVRQLLRNVSSMARRPQIYLRAHPDSEDQRVARPPSGIGPNV